MDNMNKLEAQDFQKLNEEIVKALILSQNIKTRDILNRLAAGAQDLHSKNVTVEEWEKAGNDLHNLYNELLVDDTVDSLTKGEIKIYLDQVILDNYPREKQEEKEEEPKKKVVNVKKADDPLEDGLFKDIHPDSEYDQEEFERINSDLRHGRM